MHQPDHAEILSATTRYSEGGGLISYLPRVPNGGRYSGVPRHYGYDYDEDILQVFQWVFIATETEGKSRSIK